MDDEQFDSDTSDEDYVPDGKAEEAVSEVESDGDPEEAGSGSDEEQVRGKGRKRTKKVSRSKKKAKVEDKEFCEAKNDKVEPEETKKKADDLWADFMKDTGFKPKNAKTECSSTNQKNNLDPNKPDGQQKTEKKETDKSSNKVKITQIFEFAGEEVKVEKEVDAHSAEARLLSSKRLPETSQQNKASRSKGGLSGIGNVLSQLGKKQKISVLEKTKLDWDKFKKDEDIEEELQVHNKGKDGYLDRQDFLERADLRRFEIEKNLRNTERAKRFNSAL